MKRLPYIPAPGSLAAEMEELSLRMRELWFAILGAIEDAGRALLRYVRKER